MTLKPQKYEKTNNCSMQCSADIQERFSRFLAARAPTIQGGLGKAKTHLSKITFCFFSLSLSPSETCRDVLCPGSSTCVVDQTNNAYCVTCNRVCPEVTSPDQYLCGNDGIVYASACHLRRATCLQGKSIGVAYEGKCISE